ncbi:MAG: thioesterase II family protein [Byssovorax sp.]
MKTYPPSPWLVIQRPKPQPRLRLFCFPFAGGAASIFRTWGDGFPADIEVCAVQLPGRESRVREPLARDLVPLVQPLCEALLPWLDRPFAFFGHSMGASIAFELARRVKRQIGVEPAHFFASARRAPHCPTRTPMHALPDALLIEKIRRMGGTPESVLRDAPMMELFLPIIRADLDIVETYNYVPGPPLGCPLTMLRGMDDLEVSDGEAAGWREHTSSVFTLRTLSAGHFFLSTHREQVLRWIAEALD